jgi:D-alanyl-D-alanine carboxypeptidase/D-alanyl-D-alanine-endopeptidase (penicillin-binding protein 4)
MRLRIIILALLAFSFQDINAKTIRPGKILKMIRKSPVLQQHFTGFALYDLAKKKMIAEQNGDKYFTPASNTKLFTFYAGLKLLRDSVAGLQYIERGDSLIFWGTGDPTFLNADYKHQPVLEKLKASKKKIYWATGRYTSPFYGTGWTYDDYNEYYQPEISELPVYGNIVLFSHNGSQIVTHPEFNRNSPFQLLNDPKRKTGNFRIYRDILTNDFYQPGVQVPANFNQIVPFKVNTPTISSILKSNIPNYSGTVNYALPAQYKTWYSIPSDTLYRNMLLPSDNFIAEQFLLNIAATNGLEMNTPVAIDYIIKNLLQDLPDKPLWVDGSGLSRQDLFTPRSIVRLCEKIYTEIGDEKRLFNMLPNGGKTGTLRNLYKSNEPFVFAKTGSLSNNHNQSGFLITKKGRKLIYSFMNNNFVRATAEVRNEMERIITYIHQNY